MSSSNKAHLFEVFFALALIPIVYLFFLLTGSNWFLSILPVLFIFILYLVSTFVSKLFNNYKAIVFIFTFVFIFVSLISLGAYNMNLTNRVDGVEFYKSGILTFDGFVHQIIEFGAMALAIAIFKKICFRIFVRR